MFAGTSRSVRFESGPAFQYGLKEFEVVGEAEHGQEAVEKAPSLRPDLIILDMSSP